MNGIEKIYRVGFLLIASALVIFAGGVVFNNLQELKRAETVSAPLCPDPSRPTPEPPPPVALEATDYQVIVTRNLFGATEAAFQDTQQADFENLQETSLALTLLGTIDGVGSGRRAIIQEDKDKGQNIYQEGDTVQQAFVKKILRGKVVLTLRGKDEVLSMQDDSGSHVSVAVAKPEPGGFPARPAPTLGGLDTEVVLVRSNVENLLRSTRNLQVGVLMRPHLSGGKVDGIVLTSIARESFLWSLGLRKNDIVESINGTSVTSAGNLELIRSALMSGTAVAVQFKRGGRRMTKKYTVKE